MSHQRTSAHSDTHTYKINSRSYAEDVTSVTSGASQGPHSFNLVFVCLFVCLCHAWRYPVSVPYCTVPAKTAGHNIFVCLCHRHALRYPVPVPYHQEYGTMKRMSIYAKCIGGMHSVQQHFVWICVRGRDPTSRLAGPPVDQPGNRM